MKLIYIAGPYRAPTEWQLIGNIRRAEALALQVWQLGHACICPHKNTALFGGAAPDELWLEGDLEMLRRSDAVLCTDDWQQSAGARGEVALARSLEIPVFEALDDLKRWLSTTDQSAPDRRASAATR